MMKHIAFLNAKIQLQTFLFKNWSNERNLTNAPIIALTASATPQVVEDIQKQLNFKQENVFRKVFTEMSCRS